MSSLCSHIIRLAVYSDGVKQKQQKQKQDARKAKPKSTLMTKTAITCMAGMLRTAVIRRCVSTTASACGSNKEWKAMRTEEKAR